MFKYILIAIVLVTIIIVIILICKAHIDPYTSIKQQNFNDLIAEPNFGGSNIFPDESPEKSCITEAAKTDEIKNVGKKPNIEPVRPFKDIPVDPYILRTYEQYANNGDDRGARLSLIQGQKSKLASDIQNRNSVLKWYQYYHNEMRDTENRVWWENSYLM